AALAVLVPAALQDGVEAGFSARTLSGANTFAAGTVSLTSTATSPLFSAAGLVPGDGGTACMTVTYTGTLAAEVRVRAEQAGDGTLDRYLQVVVEQDAGPASPCTAYSLRWSSATRVFPAAAVTSGALDTAGRLDALLTTCAGYTSNGGTGCGSWRPTAHGQTQTYRVSYRLFGSNAAKSTSGTTVSSAFRLVFEARNT
ncbi:hypothetical protein, partial [Kineococcus glutinatus]|uniref:hypothetical protein n=1 Tax=Kineococcus glutinatus TaxID=1070872 RepID=UPI0031EC648C